MKILKRTRIISLILSLVLVFTMFQFMGVISVSAADSITSFSLDGTSINPVGSYSGRKATDLVEWRRREGASNYYIYVPNSADKANLTFIFSASKTTLTVTRRGQPNAVLGTITSGIPTAAFKDAAGDTTDLAEYDIICGDQTYPVVIRIASPIASMFISTTSGNMNAVHADKEHREPSKMVLIDSTGATNYDGDLDRIKGRGNATWRGDSGYKNPYNIKLNKKTNLLGMGSSKGWCLLANDYDDSNLRNRIALDLGLEIGVDFTSHTQPVDLYINNEYFGLYGLTEKIDIETDHVNLTNLEDATEKANDGADLDSFGQGGSNHWVKNGYKYHNIPNNPADITGGYLLEWELESRYAAEASGFVTSRGQAVVIKEPEFSSKAQVEYIRAYVQDMENALYSANGTNAKGKHYSDYINIESFAKMYALQEYTLNLDVGITSFYIYKDSDLVGDGKLHAAPPWDFDNALGGSGDRDDAFGNNVRLSDPEVWWTNRGCIHDNKDWVGEGADRRRTYHIFSQIYTFDAFKKEVTKAWHRQLAAPADKVFNANSKSETSVVQHIDKYRDNIRASALMNRIRWRDSNREPIDNNVNFIRNFMQVRANFLSTNWKIRSATLKVDPIPAQTSTGTAITPTLVVKDGDEVLTLNTDYTVTYSNNTNAGINTATVTIRGAGPYANTITASAKFTINKSVQTATISPIPSEPYTGYDIAPLPVITDNGVALIYGLDYTLEYRNNLNAGTATVKIVGINGYAGSTSTTFKITPITVNPKISVSKSKLVHSGKAQKPVGAVSVGNKKLSNGNDYTVTYKNNKKPGKMTAVVKGKGNYSFSKTLSFTIIPSKPSSFKVTSRKRSAKITFKKISGVSGTEILSSLKKNFSGRKKTTTKKNSATVKKLKSNKFYYFKVRSFVVVNGKKVYGAYSKVIKRKIA